MYVGLRVFMNNYGELLPMVIMKVIWSNFFGVFFCDFVKWQNLWHVDGIGNIIEENPGIFYIIQMY